MYLESDTNGTAEHQDLLLKVVNAVHKINPCAVIQSSHALKTMLKTKLNTGYTGDFKSNCLQKLLWVPTFGFHTAGAALVCFPVQAL